MNKEFRKCRLIVIECYARYLNVDQIYTVCPLCILVAYGFQCVRACVCVCVLYPSTTNDQTFLVVQESSVQNILVMKLGGC